MVSQKFLRIIRVKFYHDSDLNKNEFYSTDAQLDKNSCDVNLIFMQNIRCTRFNINVFLAVQYDILLFNSSLIELRIPYQVFYDFSFLKVFSDPQRRKWSLKRQLSQGS